MFVRYMAWLNATPKPDERTKRAEILKDAPKITRREQMKKDGVDPVLPPNPMPHIIDRLIELGVTEAAGMGEGRLSWREIDAWCNCTGIDLDPWEARLLRRLSVEYVAEGRKAESENCPPPWRAPVTEREMRAEQAALEMVLG